MESFNLSTPVRVGVRGMNVTYISVGQKGPMGKVESIVYSRGDGSITVTASEVSLLVHPSGIGQIAKAPKKTRVRRSPGTPRTEAKKASVDKASKRRNFSGIAKGKK